MNEENKKRNIQEELGRKQDLSDVEHLSMVLEK